MRQENMRSENRMRQIEAVSNIDALKAGRLEQVIDMLAATVNLDAISNEDLNLIIQNGNEVAEEFTDFLKNIGRLIVEERGPGSVAVSEGIDEKKRPADIRINRAELFDPVKFMRQAGLEIEEQDERSVMLEEIDPCAIALESMLRDETVISGEEHLQRLGQTGYIRLDAKVLQTLWENQHLIPEHWKGTTDAPKYIFFDGTVLKNQLGRYVMCMYWAKDEKWRWTYCRVNVGGWRAEDLSAVLKT